MTILSEAVSPAIWNNPKFLLNVTLRASSTNFPPKYEELITLKSLSNIAKLEDVGYAMQEDKIDNLLVFVKNTIVEMDSRYEEYFKDHNFKNRYNDYPEL